MELSKQEMELFILLPGLGSKNFFYKIFVIRSKGFKTGNRIIQTGNGIISPTSRPLIKNLFYKMFLICSKGLKIDFQNRKWNYPNRKWNYFSHFQASDQKTCFTKCFLFVPRVSKLIFKTGNGIIQTGNEIISPTSRPKIKKHILRNVSHSHLIQGGSKLIL